MDDLTICVTTFLREASLERCLASIRTFYPDVKLDVLDTQGNLSAGRNKLVTRCLTPYFLLMEDDMEFTENTKLETLLDIVVSDKELIGCGGVVYEKKWRNTWMHDWWEFRGELRAVPARRDIRVTSANNPYQPCQLISNFGIFRTDEVKKYPWDEQLPVHEHQNWFYSFHKDWLVGYSQDVIIDHHADRDGGLYDQHRLHRKYLIERASQNLGLKISTPPKSDLEHKRPNIVLLGIGHSNTSITTKQIAKLGWNAPETDEEYMEAKGVTLINKRLLAGEKVPTEEMEKVLKRYTSPWIIKDPKFHLLLEHWLFAMLPYKPLLIRIKKSLEKVQTSYRRRGYDPSIEHLQKKEQRCNAQYDKWPWAKVTLDAENITEAIALFDLSRAAELVVQ